MKENGEKRIGHIPSFNSTLGSQSIFIDSFSYVVLTQVGSRVTEGIVHNVF